MNTRKRRIEAVIFDLDGTLADTLGLIVSAWNAAMRESLGRDYTPEEVYARFGPPEWQMITRELAGRPVDPRAALDRFHAFYGAMHHVVTPFDGVPEMLDAVARAGLPMGVMTGKGRATLNITLSRLGWMDAFESTVSGDETDKPKPDPEGVLKVARALGVPPERCAFVGDSPADMRAGRSAGMITVAALWHTIYGDRTLDEKPDHAAATPADVLTALDLDRLG